MMSAGVLNFPMLRGLSLGGLDGDNIVSPQEGLRLFKSQLGPKWNGGDFSPLENYLNALSSRGYVGYQGAPGSKGNLTPAQKAEIGALKSQFGLCVHVPLMSDGCVLGVGDGLKANSAADALEAQGFYTSFGKASSGSSASTGGGNAQTTVSAVVNNATTPGPDRESTSLNTFQDAMSYIAEMAPGIAAAKQAEAAKALLARQARGEQIYKQKRNRNLWIIGGVGALVMLSIVYIAVKR